MKLIWGILFLSSAAWSAGLQGTLHERLSGYTVAAHAGGTFSKAPNTLDGFEESRQDGADIIETDIRLSKDGVVVISHDEILDRWTNCKGPVRNLTWAQLKKCKYTLNGRTISSFEDALKWSHGRVVINAEFKAPEVIPATIALVQKYKAHEWTQIRRGKAIVHSFFARGIRQVG